jgi:hypothetical protein
MVVEVNGNPRSVKRFELRKIGKSFLNDVLERGPGPTGSGIEPTRHDLAMDQLNIAIAQENILRGLRREGVVTTLVKEIDGELLDAIQTTVVQMIGEAGDVKNADLAVACDLLPVVDPRRDDLSE